MPELYCSVSKVGCAGVLSLSAALPGIRRNVNRLYALEDNRGSKALDERS
jgi:hypothetical protein